MSKYTFEQVVKRGKEIGAKPSDINYTLDLYGIKKKYNPVMDKENWKNLPGNFIRNGKNIARDFRSLGGYIFRPMVDVEKAYHETQGSGIDKLSAAKKAFINSVNNDRYRKTLGGAITGAVAGAFIPKVGPIAGALTGAGLGISGGPKEMADAILHTYNTSVDDIRNKNVHVSDIVQGVFDNPLYATLDFAPVYGKGLAKQVGKATNKLPMAVRQFIPDENMRAFNRQLSNSMLSAKAKGMENYKGFLNLETMPNVNRERLVKNIITNETSGMTKEEMLLADTIKSNLRNYEKEFISRGYADPTEFRDNTAAAYVMYKMDKEPNLVHDDVYRIIRGEDLRTGNPLPSVNKINQIKKLAKEGGKLYDEGKISWLTQKLAPIADETGNVRARDFVREGDGYFDTNRIIGKQSTEKLGNVFDRTIKEQLDQLGQFINVEDTISDLVKNFEKQPIQRYAKGDVIPKGKTAFSIDAFKDYIKKHGPNTDVGDALRSAKVATEGAYLLDDMYLYMINNAFKKTPSTGSRRILNSFKKAVLANPHWVALNRLGNWSNNFMDGVTLADYRDVRLAHKAGLIPEELQHQTSFGSYINELEGADNIQGINSATRGLGKSIAQPISRIKQSFGRFKNSKKRTEDYFELAKNVIGNSSDVTANPFYKLEASLEYADRAANMISQAKRYAAKNKNVGTWKDVLKRAKTDTKLYSELNNGVNKALGDYIGRNYALPQGMYGGLSFSVPFYRFLTQTGRTTAHQLVHNPLGFMMTNTIPSRVGNKLSSEYVQMYGLNPEDYTGGVPYTEENGNIRTIALEPFPAANVLETFANMEKGTELRNILSPYLTTFPDVLSFRKYGKTASSPRRTEMMLNGQYTEGHDKFEPNIGETLAYGLDTLLNALYHPYRMSTSQAKELYNALTGGGMQSPYNTNSTRENPLTYKRTLPVELIGKWFGLQTRSNYPKKNSAFKRNLDNSMSKKLRKQVEYNKNKK